MQTFKRWLKKRPVLFAAARRVYRIAKWPLLLLHLPEIISGLCLFAWFRWWGHRRLPPAAAVLDDPRIVMLVISPLPHDPRVQREAQMLASKGFRVTVLCPQWYPVTPAPDWGPRITFRIAKPGAGTFPTRFPYIFGWRLFRLALKEPAWAYHAHDLDTALPALLAAAIRRVPCICDFHEWYAENVTFDPAAQRYHPHGWLRRSVYRMMERQVLQHASCVITVCDSIADMMEKFYKAPRKVHVLRNIPRVEACDGQAPRINLRQLLRIPERTKIVLYQGGVGPSRNLEPIIRAMAHVERAVLVIRGPGIDLYGPNYLEVARSVGATGRVFCLPAVPSADVVREARAADVGIWSLLANVGLNFKLALPNKIFEYLMAGIPILAADLPEAARLVLGYQVGLCFDPEDPMSIAAAIRRMSEDDDFLHRCRSCIRHSLADLQADKEWHKLVDLYDNLTVSAPSPAAVVA